MAMTTECAVIGAGVIGLAVARQLAICGKEVVVLEAADKIGTGASSRNSEVVHAGLYYSPGSLKAVTCVAGQRALYQYCRNKGVEHRMLGKLLVATTAEEIKTLCDIKARATANGVTALKMLDRNDIAELEPSVKAEAALWSESTGIVDSHGLMLALQGDVEDHGGVVALNCPVIGGQAHSSHAPIKLYVRDSENSQLTNELEAKVVVNCAGWHAVEVARSLIGQKAPIPDAHYCKGSYFTLIGSHPFHHLVYPVPNHGGLGMHLTLDLANQARFGPDTEWTNQVNYDVSLERVESFEKAIRRYWPGLPSNSLQPAYAGMRPKIAGPKDPPADFLVQGPEVTKVPLVNLLGIESPGLTASLALAKHVASLIGLSPVRP